MKERPILFSAPMVRAILEGRKTQTRRVVRVDQRIHAAGTSCIVAADGSHDVKFATTPMPGVGVAQTKWIRPPFGVPGDRLWVRETISYNHSIHYAHSSESGTTGMLYRASWDKPTDFYGRPFTGERRWHPSIHMPRWASRITLEVTGVRVERLQKISESDAIAEGGPPSHWAFDNISRQYGYADFPRSWYAQLWDSLNAKRGYGWDVNPWVWVVEFRRIS